MMALGDANLLFVTLNQAEVTVPLSRNPCIAGFGVLAKDWNPSPVAPDSQNEWRAAVRQRHRDRYNLGFCDGHVETLLHERLYEASDAARRRWNRDHEP
jgi:prepilin-type processing-associated H-X9-DG protein